MNTQMAADAAWLFKIGAKVQWRGSDDGIVWGPWIAWHAGANEVCGYLFWQLSVLSDDVSALHGRFIGKVTCA